MEEVSVKSSHLVEKAKKRMGLFAILSAEKASTVLAQSAGNIVLKILETTVLSAINQRLMVEVLDMPSGTRTTATEITQNMDVKNGAPSIIQSADLTSIMLLAASALLTALQARQISVFPAPRTLMAAELVSP